MFAGLNVRGQMRLTPTQKMSAEPTSERLASAVCVMMGCSSVASAVTLPCSTATGRAENRHPRPMDAAMAQTMTASSAPLRASVDQSPARPSWMEPTMAMAPMQTVSDAVTNPSTKRASPELPVLSRNHVPRVSKRASRSSSSPATVPRASEMSIVIVPCVPRVMVPSAAAVATSMCCSVPAAPTKMTHTPHARSRALWRRSVTSELARSPMVPPPTMQATFMSVPRPIMGLPALVRWRLAAL